MGNLPLFDGIREELETKGRNKVNGKDFMETLEENTGQRPAGLKERLSTIKGAELLKNILRRAVKVRTTEDASIQNSKDLLSTSCEEKKKYVKKAEWDLKEQTRKDAEIISKLQEELYKKNRQIQKLVKLLKENKSKINERLVKKLDKRIHELTELNSQKKYKIRALKRELELVKSNKLQLISGYLQENGMEQDLYNIIKPYFFEHNHSEINIKNDSEQSGRAMIGYCTIENDKHYIVLSNGTKTEIMNIPLSTYIGERQFVLVYRDFNYKKNFNSKFEEFEADYLIKSYGLAVCRDDSCYINKEDNSCSIERINNIPRTIQLRHGQVVSVGANNNFYRFYKVIWQNADTYMKSIKAKGHQLVALIKILKNGAYLRDIETGSEFIKDLDLNFCGTPVQEYQILCLEKDKIINVFSNFRFYSLSSYYSLSEHGTVEIRNNTVFLRKLSGELIIVNNIPPDIELLPEQIIFVDEKNDFIGIKQNYNNRILELPRKRTVIYKNVLKQKIPEIKKNVLIIGNKQYEFSYKMTLLKYGYKAIIFEGYESWSKINSEFRNADLIVIVPNFISHDNMWRIKKDVTDIPIIYSEHDGANRILETILELEEEHEK